MDDLQDELDDSPAGHVCGCLQVDWYRIELAIRALGLKTVEDVTNRTGAGGGCHTCWPVIEGILDRCARGEYRFQITDDELRRVRREEPRMKSSLLRDLEKRNDPAG